MSRLAAVCSVLALGGLVVLGWADSKPTKPADPFKPPSIAAKPILTPLPVPGAAPTPARTESLADRLMQPVKFAGFDDPALTLGQALDKLSKTYGVDIEVNEQAFIAEGQNDVLNATVAEKKIPRRDKIRLDRLLRTVLGKINVPSGATFLLRGDGIEVMTNQALRLQICGGLYHGPLLPLVNTTFEKKPLEDALKELAVRAEYNVVLDNRVGDKTKLPVTARFANTPLDTAAAFLADMTDLRPILLDNAVYVTTRENAAVWEARLKKEIAEEAAADRASGPRIGVGVGNLPVTPGMVGGGM